MTGVAELLAAVDASAPVQRVRNYHLTDREASPRARDFLTAMRRSGGTLCVRWPGPPGPRLVRHADPGWACAERNRFRGRVTVETVDAERVRTWLRGSRPELVAYDDVRATFESSVDAEDTSVAPDGGQVSGGTVRVRQYADLLDDPALDRTDADALASALPTECGRVAFWLPLVLAEESVLSSVAGSDRVFVADRVPERGTDRAHYVQQGPRGCWVPKAESRTYELADGAVLDSETVGQSGSA